MFKKLSFLVVIVMMALLVAAPAMAFTVLKAESTSVVASSSNAAFFGVSRSNAQNSSNASAFSVGPFVSTYSHTQGGTTTSALGFAGSKAFEAGKANAEVFKFTW